VEWTRKNFPDTKHFTVSSAPNALDFYLQIGFQQLDGLKSVNEVPYYPMHLDLG